MKGLWIPIEIVKDPSLTAVEKFILADILSMVGGGLPFFKSNSTLALDLSVSPGTISRSIGELIDKGHLELVSFDGRRRELTASRDYSKEVRQTTQKRVGSVNETSKSATSNTQHSNTVSKQLSKQVNVWWQKEELTKAWSEWKDEQKAKRKGPYSKRAETMAVNRLKELSKSDETVAINIINHAILRRWTTFWPIPKNHTKNEKGFKSDNFTTDGLSDFITNG